MIAGDDKLPVKHTFTRKGVHPPREFDTDLTVRQENGWSCLELWKTIYNRWMSRGMPRPGDVLFTTEGHTLGSAAKLPTFDKVALAQRLRA